MLDLAGRGITGTVLFHPGYGELLTGAVSSSHESRLLMNISNDRVAESSSARRNGSMIEN